MDEEITLIHPGITKDEDIKRTIFAELKDTGRDEHFAAGRAGYKRTMQFVVWRMEYDEEPELEYNGKRLTIYRTYEVDSDRIELYAGERIGNNGRN